MVSKPLDAVNELASRVEKELCRLGYDASDVYQATNTGHLFDIRRRRTPQEQVVIAGIRAGVAYLETVATICSCGSPAEPCAGKYPDAEPNPVDHRGLCCDCFDRANGAPGRKPREAPEVAE